MDINDCFNIKMDITLYNSNKTLELLKAGANYLNFRGLSEARTEADLLLAYACGVSRDKLYIERDAEICPKHKKKYLELLRRRGEREPLAYLQKTREFMGLDFYVDENVLIPRPETELLVEKALAIGKGRVKTKRAEKVRVLDLCTGSGALAVAIAHLWPQAMVTATDISAQALRIAQKNAVTHCQDIVFLQGDLLTPILGRTFDMIISNPPYVSEKEYATCSAEVQKEPSLALLGGEDGLDFYRRISEEAAKVLAPGGIILLEIGCAQGSGVTKLFREKGYHTNIFKDYAGHDRIVMAEIE